MKNIIVNILVLILMFNVIMIIFPEGKTQKFCRISIKIFIMIYILDNIFLNGSMDLGFYDLGFTGSAYEREVSLNNIDKKIIDSINEAQFEGDDVVNNIRLSFDEDMNIKAFVSLNKLLSMDEINKLRAYIAEVIQISSDNIFIE